MRAKPFLRGSGRLELAEAIASPQNPLTARVIVNRVWMHHFGAGLVRTTSDFGIRGSGPSHAELLDYLASRFMQEGWSLKKLHRQILLSAVYQQASVLRRDQEEKDPENKLLWRKNPSRLEFEPMRDSWLAVAGNLDLKIGGRGFDIQNAAERGRRSVYAFIDRQDLPQLFRTFDFASPDVSTAQRPQTTIPQQALFSLNSSFLLAQARALIRSDAGKDPAERIRLLYRRVFARDPSDAELQSDLAYITDSNATEPPDDVVSAWHYGYGTLDVDAKRVRAFHRVSAVRRSTLGRNKASGCRARLGASHRAGRPSRQRSTALRHPPLGLADRGRNRHSRHARASVRARGRNPRLDHFQPAGSAEGMDRQAREAPDRRSTRSACDRGKRSILSSIAGSRTTATDSAGHPSSKRNSTPARPTSVVQLWHSANDFSGPPPPRLIRLGTIGSGPAGFQRICVCRLKLRIALMIDRFLANLAAQTDGAFCTRREMLVQSGLGMGVFGLASLLGGSPARAMEFENPLTPKSPHFPAKAKHIIHIFLNGGPSHVDTFDPKPVLAKYAGKPLPNENLRTERKTGAAFPSPVQVQEVRAKRHRNQRDLFASWANMPTSFA